MAVSQAAAKLYTNPARVAVTTNTSDTWAIDLAHSLNAGEAIASAAAALVRVSPAPEEDVADFVTSTSVDGEIVLVGWTGSVLTAGALYRLEVSATLDTGAVIDRLMHIEVAA